jgi:transcription elongation factor Elf1
MMRHRNILDDLLRGMRLFRKKAEQSKPPSKPQKPADQFTACIFCGHTRFYEGPSGGLSQNITCSNCGARFNIGLLPDGPILLDVLSEPTDKPTKD